MTAVTNSIHNILSQPKNNMKLEQAFAICFKYGKRETHNIKGFLEDEINDPSNSWKEFLNKNSNSFQVLQDYLEEADDPRSELVRQTLATPKDKRYLNSDYDPEEKIHHLNLFDNNTTFENPQYEFTHRKSNPDVVHVGWFAAPGVKYGFFGDLTHSQVRELANNLDNPDKQKQLHTFLDSLEDK